MSGHITPTIQPVQQEEDPILPQDQSPLLATEQTQPQKVENDDAVTNLDKTLQKLDSVLTLLGFNQSSVSRLGISWVAFLLIGVALPVVVLELSNCPGCDKFQIKSFELDIIASQACLAAVSLFCVSFNLRKYGLRKFLFVDRFSGQMERFPEYYMQNISVSSIVQVVGITLCLNAAAKISHRAQGIASIASRWHALAACTSTSIKSFKYCGKHGGCQSIALSCFYLLGK